MAFIKESDLKRMDKERNTIHNKFDAAYTIFTKNGEKYFQIDTFGSNERQVKGKISQSIQLDRNAALKMIDILKNEFDII